LTRPADVGCAAVLSYSDPATVITPVIKMSRRKDRSSEMLSCHPGRAGQEIAHRPGTASCNRSAQNVRFGTRPTSAGAPVDTSTLLRGLLSFAAYMLIIGAFAWARFTSADVTS
jgi:hypothetical protein